MKQNYSLLDAIPMTTKSNWRFPTPLLLAATIGLAGCKTKNPAAADVDAAGTYALVSVDGNPVPCTTQHNGTSMTIKSGAFTINADGTCGSKMTFSVQSRGDTTREVKATYKQDGSKLTMKWQGAGTTVGTLEGQTFSMNNEGMVFAYRK